MGSTSPPPVDHHHFSPKAASVRRNAEIVEKGSSAGGAGVTLDRYRVCLEGVARQRGRMFCARLAPNDVVDLEDLGLTRLFECYVSQKLHYARAEGLQLLRRVPH